MPGRYGRTVRLAVCSAGGDAARSTSGAGRKPPPQNPCRLAAECRARNTGRIATYPPRPSRPIAVESDGPETSDPEDEGSFDDPVEPDTWDEAAANKDDFDNGVVTAYGSGHSSQTTGSIHIRGTRNPASEAPEKNAFSHSATPAKFRNGGIVEFRKWVQRRVRKPKKPLPDQASGRVVVSFVVDTLGRVTQIELLRVPDQALADEAVRVLRRAPRWKPARQGDRPVPMKFVTPVDFQ